MNKSELHERYPVYLTQSVVWGDMDAFEHVNNTVYFRYFEDARMEYFTQLQVMEHLKETHVGPILASTRCDFRAPLDFPDDIVIGAWIDQIAEKRFTMHYRVHSLSQQRLVAEGDGLVVFYDYANKKSSAIPQHIVDNIARLQQGFKLE
ncbi:acyl-CoA thioesterase [Alkalimarinus sediminis]|uniref:Acyl-CoA thioesterase n=1 Tax=Alkalimarinus sediminis TaxID=1632866 RepID=A0A9E8HHM4_9ALTE|nr:thioesterase family protein [Alkalimarinus sediminis]UZW74470.1 acyl-CoA thioesterase [Alkalimarinus sediminis]